MKQECATVYNPAVEELKRQVEFYKIDQRVTAGSSTYHIRRCRLLEQANEAANALIGDISCELGAIIERQTKELHALRSNNT